MEKSFSSWEQFKREYKSIVGTAAVHANRWVFRGQADARWHVESSFDRTARPGSIPIDAYYEKLLGFYCYQLRQYGEDLDDLSRQDRGAVAQHYGMPTRLIDWSRSPYVAAFMAFFSALERPAERGLRCAIWALDLEAFTKAARPDAPFRIVKTRLLTNDRVWRQAGLFTEACGTVRHFDEFVWDGPAPDDPMLIRFTIPARDAADALNDLILMGLTPASIYPDRDGAAKYVKLRLALDRARDADPSA